jgi:hypothetical protein
VSIQSRSLTLVVGKRAPTGDRVRFQDRVSTREHGRFQDRVSTKDAID